MSGRRVRLHGVVRIRRRVEARTGEMMATSHEYTHDRKWTKAMRFLTEQARKIREEQAK